MAPSYPAAMSVAHEYIDQVIRSRRTHKAFAAATDAGSQTALGESVQRSLLDLIRWAPNHRQAEPWRCYALNSEGIKSLDSFFEANPHIASWPEPGKEKKLAKLRSHYLAHIGFIIHLTSQKDDDELKDRENYAACAAAAQNALLGAEARGLASFWSSSAAMRHPDTQRWLGVDLDREHFVGSLWFGNRCLDPNIISRKPIDSYTTWIS